MKIRQRLKVSAIVLAVIAGGLFFRQRPLRDSGRAAVDGERPSLNATAAPDEQKPVGWVFGRLMGFPGADRPLSTTVGPANRPPPPPPPASGSSHP